MRAASSRQGAHSGARQREGTPMGARLQMLGDICACVALVACAIVGYYLIFEACMTIPLRGPVAKSHKAMPPERERYSSSEATFPACPPPPMTIYGETGGAGRDSMFVVRPDGLHAHLAMPITRTKCRPPYLHPQHQLLRET